MRVTNMASKRLEKPGSALGSNRTVRNPFIAASNITGPAA